VSPRQKRLTSSEVIRILIAHGFEKVSQKGSHQKWKHFGSGAQVIVPFHKGRQLPIGTLKSIIEGSGLSPEVWN
jgi:predicted RNA binding protein YcfA (HicA-like mRNA interferase family)